MFSFTSSCIFLHFIELSLLSRKNSIWARWFVTQARSYETSGSLTYDGQLDIQAKKTSFETPDAIRAVQCTFRKLEIAHAQKRKAVGDGILVSIPEHLAKFHT